MAGLPNRLPVAVAAWLPNEVPVVGSRRGLARKRRERADTELQSDMPTTVLHTLNEEEHPVTVMIGIDPHKGSHTAVAVDAGERSLAELRVRSGPKQLDRLLGWAQPFPERTWA